ncbi:hypothetical protein [Actinomadura gamaensis]|uniref:Tetratricopeptide repeat protein n=1 Tax=Actinomadura gamaensis TaxID=1763541 RepID=A0ABV9UAN3_9ACTN
MTAAYRSLSPKLDQVWRLLSLLPGRDFDAEEAAALLGTDSEKTMHCLAALHAEGLLAVICREGCSDLRWQIPTTLRSDAARYREQDVPIEQQEQAINRLLGWVQPAAEWAAACATPYRASSQQALVANRSRADRPELDAPGALRWLTDHHETITGCVRIADDHGQFKRVIALAATEWPPARHHLIDPGNWWVADTTALRAAEALNDQEAAARILDRLGVWGRRTGNHEQAIDYHCRAADRWALLGNPVRRAESRRRIGHVLLARQQIQDALELFEAAEFAFEQIPTDQGRRNLGLTLVDIAAAHLAADRPDEPSSNDDDAFLDAFSAARRGYELIRAHAPLDLTSQARALVVKGEAGERLHYTGVLDDLRKARDLARQAGAVSVQVAALDVLADALRRHGAQADAAAVMVERRTLATRLRS